MKVHRWMLFVLLCLLCAGCGSAALDGAQDSNGSQMDSMLDSSTNGSENSQNKPNTEIPEHFEDEDAVMDSDSEADNKPDGTTENVNPNSDWETSILSVFTSHDFEVYNDAEGDLVESNHYWLRVQGDAVNEELEEALLQLGRKRRQDFDEQIFEMMPKTRKLQDEMQDTSLLSSISNAITICRADTRLLSFIERKYAYCGDEWDHDYFCANFDVESGKPLLLSDLLVDKEGFERAVIDYCLEELKNNYNVEQVDDILADEIYKMITGIENWCLDASGFVFVYEDDELEFSYEGVIFIHVPYAVVGQYMKREYIWGDDYGVASLSANQFANIKVDNLYHEIYVETEVDEYGVERIRVRYAADKVRTVGENLRLDNIYLLKHKDWNYLLLDVDIASEDYETYFYELGAGKIEKSFYMEGNLDESNVRVNNFGIGVPVDTFGSYMSYPVYFLTDEGKVVTYQEEFEIEYTTYQHRELVTKRELPLRSSLENLPAGSRLLLLSTDEESWAKFLWLDESITIEIAFERKDGMIYIDGVSEYECFEMLPYAG